MKNQILDYPIMESFEDSLTKNETILWRYTLNQKIEIPIILNDEGAWIFNLERLKWHTFIILFITVLGIPMAYFENNWSPLLFSSMALLLNLLFEKKIYGTKVHPTQYAITSKRILFRLSHLGKNEIQEIPLSQINNCLVTIDKETSGTIFLSVKDPASIPFETYHIISAQETELRHQPTLESIENVNEVAELIREQIEKIK